MYWTCIRDPWHCRPADFTESGSAAFVAFTESVDQRIAQRRYIGPEDVGYLTVTKVESIDDYQLVTTCSYITAAEYVKSSEGSDQPDQIFESNSGTTVNTWKLAKDKADQRWRVRQKDAVSDNLGVNECPPKG